jgi:hypothetical protein
LEGPNSVNVQFYQEHCLRRSLVPFINKHHIEDDILFWLDLAFAHYANSTLQVLRDLNISFVEKECNLSMLPNQVFLEFFKVQSVPGRLGGSDSATTKEANH